MPKISVIIPTYGVENYIGKCIDSLKNQTYYNFEVILVNDGTQDNSVAVANNHIAGDTRFRWVHKENGGLSSARNAGITNATTEYVQFLDPDDYLSDTTIESCMGALDSECDILVFDIVEITESNKIIRIFKSDVSGYYLKNDLIFSLRTISYSACNKVFKKEIFDSIQFPVGRLLEDRAVMHRLFYDKKIKDVTNASYYYVRRNGSIMNSYNKKFILDFIFIYKDYQEFLKEIGLNDKLATSIYNKSYIHELYFKLILYITKFSPEFKKDYSELIDITNRDILSPSNIIRYTSIFSLKSWFIIIFDKFPSFSRVLFLTYKKIRGY